VFLFKYGAKIFDKVMAAMQPEFEDETPINPFDFWQGANFKLKIRKVDGYWNYDKSEFDRPGSLLDDDDTMEAIWKKEYSLNQLIAPTEFKTYEELEKRLKYVLGQKATPRYQNSEENEDEDNTRGSFTPSFESRNQTSELPDNLSKELNSIGSSSYEEEGEDDAMSYFQRLAES
jgi:hypothetical protein